jgi:hypothetical protein
VEKGHIATVSERKKNPYLSIDSIVYPKKETSKGKYPKFGVTGQQGFKLNGKFGNLTRYETKLKPFQFGYGTIYATSERGAKIKLKRLIKQK